MTERPVRPRFRSLIARIPRTRRSAPRLLERDTCGVRRSTGRTITALPRAWLRGRCSAVDDGMRPADETEGFEAVIGVHAPRRGHRNAATAIQAALGTLAWNATSPRDQWRRGLRGRDWRACSSTGSSKRSNGGPGRPGYRASAARARYPRAVPARTLETTDARPFVRTSAGRLLARVIGGSRVVGLRLS